MEHSRVYQAGMHRVAANGMALIGAVLRYRLAKLSQLPLWPYHRHRVEASDEGRQWKTR